MDSEKPYITKRPHKKSRNGCIPCKQRKQKCDEVQPTCGSCNKRKASCQYITRPSTTGYKTAFKALESSDITNGPFVVERSSSASSRDESASDSQKTPSETSVEDSNSDDQQPLPKQSVSNPGIRSLQPMPWQNKLEHRLYDSFYNSYREGLTKPGLDGATRDIWLDLVPRIALTTDRTLFVLLLSLGSLHSATKLDDYPALQPGTPATKLWTISMHYFAEAIAKFRTNIMMYDTNPEIFCITALVLSARSGMNAIHKHTDVESLYDDNLAWYSSTLGYIALGGFYTRRLSDTRLGQIMKANPQATYHFYPFLEYIRTQEFPYFDYLHPEKDSITGKSDSEDTADEALNTYATVLKLVGWVYQFAKSGATPADVFGAFHTVPYTVPHHFLHLLRQRKPRAIAILAHHIALTAFLGTYEGLHFWPHEHVRLLQTMVPKEWLWAFDKAIEVVEEGKQFCAQSTIVTLSASRDPT